MDVLLSYLMSYYKNANNGDETSDTHIVTYKVQVISSHLSFSPPFSQDHRL